MVLYSYCLFIDIFLKTTFWPTEDLFRGKRKKRRGIKPPSKFKKNKIIDDLTSDILKLFKD